MLRDDGPRGLAPGILNVFYMEQLNRIELRGTVGNVRLQRFDDRSVANVTLCTNYAYKDREGIAVIETTWHTIVAWEGKDIQNLDQIKKGGRLQVSGRIRNRGYTGADGVDRTVTEVYAKKIQILDDYEDLAYEM